MSDISKVRVLIPDLDSANKIFDDNEIQLFLDIFDGNVLRAAASAVDAVATNEALMGKYVRTDDLLVRGDTTATAIRKHAEGLRDQADVLDKQEASDGFTLATPPAGFPWENPKRRPEASMWSWV